MASGNTLSDRIAALAHETPVIKDGARQLEARGDMLEAILDEIDTTVLGSELTFETQAASLRILVSSRRLVAIGGTEGAVSVPDDLIGETLTMDSSDHVGAVANLLRGFAEQAEDVLVRSESQADADVADSLSVSALRAALGLVVDDPDASPIERFLTRIEQDVMSLLCLKNGAVSRTQGSIQLLQGLKIALSTQLQPFLDSRTKICPSHSDPSLTLCHDTIAPGTGMAIAVHGDDVVLFAFSNEALGRVCAAWQRVC